MRNSARCSTFHISELINGTPCLDQNPVAPSPLRSLCWILSFATDRTQQQDASCNPRQGPAIKSAVSLSHRRQRPLLETSLSATSESPFNVQETTSHGSGAIRQCVADIDNMELSVRRITHPLHSSAELPLIMTVQNQQVRK